MIWREDLLRQIEETLSILTVRVKLSNSQGRTDINSHAEDFYCGLLNIVLGTNLKNLNLLQMDFPAVDLADGDAGLCVQVTSTEARSKITKTLEKFFRHELDKKYGRLIVLMIGVKDTYRDAFKVEREFDFDPDRDIWDTPHLLDEITRLNDETLEKVANYLREKLKLYTEEQSVLLNLPLRTAMNENNFVGRERELDEIAERFGRHEKIVFLSGLGGMGKTELALRYGQDHRDAGRGLVYFVRFTGSFERTVLDNIVPSIPDLSREGKSEEQILAEAMAVLRRCGREDLLILDNADGAVESVDQLRRKLSALPMKVLVTTRAEDDGAIGVGRLENGRLYEIFRNHRVDISEGDMDALIAAVDGHTLTVDLMARSMVKGIRRTSAKKLLDALKKRDLASGSFTKVGAAFPGASRQARINEHLRTVFRVASLSEGEQQLLRLATLLPENGLDPELFTAALEDSDEVADTLDELVDKGWLTMKKDLLAIHPVICIVCREELKPTDENCGAFLGGLWEQYDPKHYDKDRFRQLGELFSGAADDLADPLGDWALLAGWFWRDLGEAPKALDYELRTVAKREQRQPDSEELATAYNNVGGTYRALGDHERELEYQQKALAIREQVLPPDHPDLAGSYNNVGITYGALGDHEKELEYKLKALAIREKVLPRSHPDLAGSYNNVGLTYGELGDHERELEYQQKALAIFEKILPPEHPSLATSYNNVGGAYGALGDHERELEYEQKALAIREKVLPPDHPSLATSYNNVGGTYYASGDYERALEYQQKALAIQEKVLPAEHPYNVMCCSNIAVTYAQMDDFVKASEYADRALEKAERSMQGHPDLERYRQAAKMMQFLAMMQEMGLDPNDFLKKG